MRWVALMLSCLPFGDGWKVKTIWFLYVFIIWMWWRTSNRYHSPAVLFPVQGAGVLIHPQFNLCRKMMRACHSTLQRWQRPLFWPWWDWIQLCHSKRVRLNQKRHCDPLIVWRKRDRERERENFKYEQSDLNTDVAHPNSDGLWFRNIIYICVPKVPRPKLLPTVSMWYTTRSEKSRHCHTFCWTTAAGWRNKPTNPGCFGIWWWASLWASCMSWLLVAFSIATWPFAIRQPSTRRCILAILASTLCFRMATEHCRCFGTRMWPVPKPLQGVHRRSDWWSWRYHQPTVHCWFVGPPCSGGVAASYRTLATKLQAWYHAGGDSTGGTRELGDFCLQFRIRPLNLGWLWLTRMHELEIVNARCRK